MARKEREAQREKRLQEAQRLEEEKLHQLEEQKMKIDKLKKEEEDAFRFKMNAINERISKRQDALERESSPILNSRRLSQIGLVTHNELTVVGYPDTTNV
jgi:hypothetical protein